MPAALAMRSRLGWQLVSSYYTSVSLVQTDSGARAARNLDFLVACLSSAILIQAVNVNYPLQSLRNQTCDHFPTSRVLNGGSLAVSTAIEVGDFGIGNCEIRNMRFLRLLLKGFIEM